jgi:hypothetical protein
MVYIYWYIPLYKFKYVYVHIRVRQQLEYKLNPLVSVGITNRDIPTETKGGGRRCWRAPL